MPPADDHATTLLKDTLVWDNHSCMPLRPDDHSYLEQLARCRDAGIDVVTLNLGMDLTSRSSHLDMLDSFKRWIDQNPDHYTVVRNVAEIDQARRDGKLAIAFDLEGMALLDDGDLDLVEELRSQGAFWMLVAYNRNNRAGGGCLDEDTGLSRHGRAILAEMKRVGMVACCSHTGHRTALEVMEHADNPVIFSHSNPSAVFEHVRNIPDSLIRACAETGGVIGINGLGDFLGPGEDYAAMMVQHIDHVADLAGPEHVAISLDYVFDQSEVYDFIDKMRESFGDEMASQFTCRFAPPDTFPHIVAALLKKGYTEETVSKILGGNWLRVAQEVWG
ncbi:MAG: membrane dipeptidase [Xanthomonadales bacterium]|nr:membrane dipeptidase [Xanthomonadales bacterium]